eukprot:SAG31_NODE_22144_length_532_cov_2.757506_1_plen_52_part_10
MISNIVEVNWRERAAAVRGGFRSFLSGARGEPRGVRTRTQTARGRWPSGPAP